MSVRETHEEDREVRYSERTEPTGASIRVRQAETARGAPPSDDRVARLRQEIAETRAELSETIDAIQEKLNPSMLADQAKERVREATIGRAEQMVGTAEETARDTARKMRMSVMDTIRENPMPAALAGLGLGWLLMKRSNGQRHDRVYQGYDRVYQGYPTYGQAAAYPGSTYSQWDASSEPGPGERAGQMMGQMRENAGYMARDAGSSMKDTLSQNPLPLALTGIGLAWFLMGRSSGGNPPYRAHSGTHYWQGNAPRAEDQTHGTMGQTQQRAGEMAGQAQHRAGEMAGQAQQRAGEAVGQAQQRAGEMVGQAQERAGHMVGQVTDTARHMAGGMQEAPRRATSMLEDMVQSNPLMAGAVAMAVGAALGMAVPPTAREQELLGEARDRAFEKAQQTAQDTMHQVQERVQHVAQQATESAMKAAQEESAATRS